MGEDRYRGCVLTVGAGRESTAVCSNVAVECVVFHAHCVVADRYLIIFGFCKVRGPDSF